MAAWGESWNMDTSLLHALASSSAGGVSVEEGGGKGTGGIPGTPGGKGAAAVTGVTGGTEATGVGKGAGGPGSEAGSDSSWFPGPYSKGKGGGKGWTQDQTGKGRPTGNFGGGGAAYFRQNMVQLRDLHAPDMPYVEYMNNLSLFAAQLTGCQKYLVGETTRQHLLRCRDTQCPGLWGERGWAGGVGCIAQM